MTCWPEDLLDAAGVPAGPGHFLARVGLPRKVAWDTRFDLTLNEMRRSVSDPRFLIIGFNIGVRICLAKATWCVLSLEGQRVERFVNTDVRRFGISLVVFERYRSAVCLLDERVDTERQLQLVYEAERLLKETDPPAFVDEESWWSVTTEQMRDGFL